MSATNQDNDTAGVQIVETGGDTELLEDGVTDTYTVVLISRPTHDVHVFLDPDIQVHMDPAGPLVFTPANWDSAQTVTVSAVDDDVVEGVHTGTIVHSTLSDDPLYDGIGVDGVTAVIGDNDTAGVHIVESGGDTEVVEGGATDTYTIVLTSEPTHDVYVSLGPDSQVNVDPAGPLVFTPASWDSAQTVTVSAVDDDLIEGVHTGTIVHATSSTDPAYNAIGADSVTAHIGDDDTAGVHILQTGDDTEVGEGGATDTYHVVLTSQPTQDVHVLLAPDAQVGVDPAGPLVFTPTNWDSAQTVTVSAVDDDVAEGLHTGTIVHTTSSRAPLYNGISVDSVTAVIGDNDTAGVQILQTGGSTELLEGGTTDTYQVVLTSQPTHDVHVLLDPDSQVNVDPAGPLVFTPANWDSAQTVTVSAVDDGVSEGLHTGTIVHTTSSTDPRYTAIIVDGVTANIRDNSNSPPSIGSLSNDPDPVERGDNLSLTANDVVDPDGDVASVTFWRDSNGDQALDGLDEELGADGNPGDGWGLLVSTASFPLGEVTYFARATDSGGRLSNVASAAGVVQGSVELYGTDLADTITFTTGANHVVTINGDEYVYDPAEVSVINIHALDGRDSITITGSADDETAELRVGSVDVVGATYRVHAESVATIIVRAGGGVGNRAYLYDSDAAQDTLVATPEYGRLYGDGFNNRVEGFQEVTALAAGTGPLGTAQVHTDLALLHDSVEADVLEATPEYGKLKFGGNEDHFVQAVGFRYLHVYGTPGGGDQALLQGDPNGQDTFEAWPDNAKLSGDGYFLRAKSFADVRADGTPGGNDLALLHDDPGSIDTFEGGPDQAELSGDAFFLQANSFRYVHAYATAGGSDVATFQDDPDQFDRLRAWPGEAKLWGEEFFLRAKSFRYLYANSTPGVGDLALLYDSVTDDAFTAWPDRAEISGDTFFTQANAFRWVHAYSTEGNDVATFYGSEDRDVFVGRDRFGKMRGTTFYNRAVSFGQLHVYGGAGRDVAVLYDAVLEAGVTQPVDMTQVAWLYEIERIRQRSDSGQTITDVVDEIFTAYWE